VRPTIYDNVYLSRHPNCRCYQEPTETCVIKKIAIIGYGFVGKSVHNSLLNDYHDIYIDDPKKGFDRKGFLTPQQYIAFICVPTPTIGGIQDLSMIENALEKAKLMKAELIVIKSTILPEIAKGICKKNVIYVPEFLDQANSYHQNNKHIVGTENVYNFERYKKLFNDNHEYFLTNPETASMIKYTHNTHGALKVSFFNEIFDACDKSNIDYREMLRILLSINDNVGEKYTKICADGMRGYGGTCFPKDTQALMHEYSLKTLIAADMVNQEIRKVDTPKN